MGMSDSDIVTDNIHALQQLYFAWMLDELSAFQVVDQLVELFERGLLPVDPQSAESSFGEWRSARAAVSEAERRSLYARVFGIGGAENTAAPNRDFLDLWTRFLSAVSAFDRQHAPLVVAIGKQVHAAIALLSHPEVRAARMRMVDEKVRQILTSSDAYQSLSAETREEIARDTTRIASELISDVDFPDFVAGLIQGTFGAIVDASIRQMEAYTKLVHDVVQSLDANLTDRDLQDCLLKRIGGRRRLASDRQQLLSTMVMMGINRVVSDG
jgi:hypothetical protein